ncbi:DNA polymerase I [Desulfonatronovibrio magnus]|uniref:DNA polymerase I n=1 Tax=Desulfonatronovibrio magnus TaxID=698827 RepID=UPI0005EB08D0|nr:DNA polymerase I [Desulfonatronovibrio magnus]
MGYLPWEIRKVLREKLSLKGAPVYLIDGSSFLYRAFYAFPDLKRSDGFPTNAIYIVLRILLRLMREEKPGYAALFMDGKGPTFRNEIFQDYKAQRPKMPEDLSVQIEPLLDAVGYLGFKTYVSNGVEADDLIAGQTETLKKDHPVVIVASDKDLRQLLDDQVVMWDPGGKKEVIMTVSDFKKQTGLTPDQWPDYQALVGDKSDNIPGVPGIGPKSASALLADFPSLETIRDDFENIPANFQKKLKDHLEKIFIYRELTRLKKDSQPEIKAHEIRVQPLDNASLTAFLEKFEFRTLLREAGSLAGRKVEKKSSMLAEGQPFVTRKSGLPDLNSVQCAGIVPEGKLLLVGVDSEEWELNSRDQSDFSGIKKYVFSLKELARIDSEWLESPVSEFFDISLAAYLLNTEAREYDYKHIYRAYSQEISVHKDNKAQAALQLGLLLQKRIADADLLPLLEKLEMPLIPVLLKMERAGIGIDLKEFSEFLEMVKEKLDKLTRDIFAQAGKMFNIRSTQQTATVLFEDLALKPRRKTPGGAYSTSNVVLEAMKGDHPIIELILQYRTFEKLRSTYLEPLPGKVGKDGRLHTTFNQLATATGRLSSSNPNLQNIPIRGEFGPKTRSCFVARAGQMLVSADYSQIELRILAHMSQDPNLLQSFARKEDIHTRTAGLLFEKDIADVNSDERRKAKTINFGLLYGMGPQKMSRELLISLDEAKKFIKIYFSKLEKVRKFYDDIEKTASSKGYVTTIAGRRRLLPDINSRNSNLAQQAGRMAINTVVQGSAADVIKKAMLAVDRDPELRRMGAVLILQIHDELLMEVDQQYAEEAGARLAYVMSSVEKFDVPLEVDWGIGKNWAEAHE